MYKINGVEIPKGYILDNNLTVPHHQHVFETHCGKSSVTKIPIVYKFKWDYRYVTRNELGFLDSILKNYPENENKIYSLELYIPLYGIMELDCRLVRVEEKVLQHHNKRNDVINRVYYWETIKKF